MGSRGWDFGLAQSLNSVGLELRLRPIFYVAFARWFDPYG